VSSESHVIEGHLKQRKEQRSVARERNDESMSVRHRKGDNWTYNVRQRSQQQLGDPGREIMIGRGFQEPHVAAFVQGGNSLVTNCRRRIEKYFRCRILERSLRRPSDSKKCEIWFAFGELCARTRISTHSSAGSLC
jgi:hypothetical protein